MEFKEYLKEYVLGKEMTEFFLIMFFALVAFGGFFGLAFWLAGRLMP